MINDHYDICILGAGLSGSLMALLAGKRGLNICIINKRRATPQSNNFLPLETVTNSFFQVLTEYEIDGISLKNENHFIQKNKKMISAWGTTNATTLPDEQYFHIDKIGLDNYLRSMFTDRFIKVFESCATLRYRFGDNKWVFKVSDEQTVSCDLVVDATGRNSIFATRQKVQKVFFDDHYALFHTASSNPLAENFFILESASNGWWYSTHSNNFSQTVFISPLKDIKKQKSQLYYQKNLAETYFIKQAQKGVPNGRVRIKDARCGILSQTCGVHWIAIGDSAFTLDPLSGMANTTIAENNISILGSIIEFIKTKKNQHLKDIDRINNEIFFSHLVQKKKYYALEKRWPLSLFWNN